MSQSLSTTEQDVADADIRTGRSLWGDAARRIGKDVPALICLGIIVSAAIIALVAGLAYPDWDKMYDYDNINEAPSLKYWLGTDEFGRSVMIKTMLGTKVSMTIGMMAMTIAIPLGMLLGAVAGYYGGFIDDVIVWLLITLGAIPGLMRVIAIKFAFDKVFFKDSWFEMDLSGMAGIYIALAVTGWIGTCRVVRAETMKIRELDYVLAAKASGCSGLSIMLRHIIPNLLHIGIINFSLGFVGCIAAEVTLSYLGMGVQGLPSWGQMISDARMDLVVGRWWQLAAAGSAMFLLVLAFNIFGDRLRDALDPKLRNV